jgi:PEP-CTERM motif
MNIQPGASRFVGVFRGTRIAIVGLLLFALGASSAQAVVISGSTYAAETGGPAPNPVSKSYPPPTTSLTSVSGSIRSDVVYSHSQSWAQATVTGSGVVKSSGGRGWVDVPPTAVPPLYDGKANLWNAFASGTTLVANYTGLGAPPPATTTFQFQIPQNGVPGFNSAGTATILPTDPAQLVPPSNGQGLVLSGSNGSLAFPSFFDVFVQVDATAQQGSTFMNLFHGTFTFDPGTRAFTSKTGGFAGINFGITPDAVFPNTYHVSFPTINGGSFDAAVGVPFNANIDVYATMGDPNRSFNSSNPSTYPTPYDFTPYNNPLTNGQPVGAGGTITTNFFLTDPSNFTVSAVPEPSSLALAALGGMGMVLALRKRLRSR